MHLNEIQIPDDFQPKKQIESLKTIFKIVTKNKEKLALCDYKNSDLQLIETIRLLANEIYSACEVINQMLISIYRCDNRYRGTQLKRGFNDNFKEVYNSYIKKDKGINEIYKDKFISEFFYNAKSWFIPLHDIRTQEAHYGVGRIEIIDETPVYVNENRNGVSKTIYSNPSNETKITLKEFIFVIDDFLQTEEKISAFLKCLFENKS